MTLKSEEAVINQRLVSVGPGYVQHAVAGCEGDHAFLCHSYEIAEVADLRGAVAFACSNYLRRRPKKARQQLIYVYGDIEDPSLANVERPVDEQGHSSEWANKESLIDDWELSTAVVKILDDYLVSNENKTLRKLRLSTMSFTVSHVQIQSNPTLSAHLIIFVTQVVNS